MGVSLIVMPGKYGRVLLLIMMWSPGLARLALGLHHVLEYDVPRRPGVYESAAPLPCL